MPKPKSEKESTFSMGDVGPHATVQQGHHQTIAQIRGGSASDDLATILTSLDSLRRHLAASPHADAATKALSDKKIQALEEALKSADEDPDTLHLTLLDTESWLTKAAGWAWTKVHDALTSEAGQKVICGISEGAAKAGIEMLLRG